MESYLQLGLVGQATAGSFVRPSRTSNKPLGFLEALREKYVSTSPVEASMGRICISGKMVEEVGFDKINRQLAALQELQIVILDSLCIAGVGNVPERTGITANGDLSPASLSQPPGSQEIKTQCFKISELDLSRNLLETWVDVVGICDALESLQTLKLDGNRFRDTTRISHDGARDSFKRVIDLSMESTFLCWYQIVYLTESFQSLRTLSVASNGITTLTLSLPTHHLTKINLAFNNITSLESIACLSSLPHLTTMSLHSNPLTTLSSPVSDPIRFSALKKLDLASTHLPTPTSLVPHPTTIPKNNKINTKMAPLASHPSAPLHTIARLATITELNYEKITPEKRLNAELFYLSLIAKELATTSDALGEKQVLDEHPRWTELCKIHGEPAVVKKSAGVDGAGTLRARVTEFTFYMIQSVSETAQQQAQSPTDSAKSGQQTQTTNEKLVTKPKDRTEEQAGTKQIVTRRQLVPRTIDVYRLKGIVCRLFGVPFLSCKLIWETDEWDPVGGREEDGWSVSEDESDEERREERKSKQKDGSKWKRRDMELTDGTREVGFWVEGPKARVRVELR